MYDFSRIFLMLYSIYWPNFIVYLPLLLEILGNMRIVIICSPICDAINLEIKNHPSVNCCAECLKTEAVLRLECLMVQSRVCILTRPVPFDHGTFQNYVRILKQPLEVLFSEAVIHILQLRFKFKTAMVSCSRFWWITNSSDHRRIWTGNFLHAM